MALEHKCIICVNTIDVYIKTIDETIPSSSFHLFFEEYAETDSYFLLFYTFSHIRYFVGSAGKVA